MTQLNTALVEKLKLLTLLYPERETTVLKTPLCYQLQLLHLQPHQWRLPQRSDEPSDTETTIDLAWRQFSLPVAMGSTKSVYYLMIRYDRTPPVYMTMDDTSGRLLTDTDADGLAVMERVVDILITRACSPDKTVWSGMNDFTDAVANLYELIYLGLLVRPSICDNTPGLTVFDAAKDCWKLEYEKDHKTYSIAKQFTLTRFSEYSFVLSDATRRQVATIKHHPTSGYHTLFTKPKKALSDAEMLGLHFALYVMRKIVTDVLDGDSELLQYIEKLTVGYPILDKDRVLIEA